MSHEPFCALIAAELLRMRTASPERVQSWAEGAADIAEIGQHLAARIEVIQAMDPADATGREDGP